jgi:hypothetical protein
MILPTARFIPHVKHRERREPISAEEYIAQMFPSAQKMILPTARFIPHVKHRDRREPISAEGIFCADASFLRMGRGFPLRRILPHRKYRKKASQSKESIYLRRCMFSIAEGGAKICAFLFPAQNIGTALSSLGNCGKIRKFHNFSISLSDFYSMTSAFYYF